MVLSLLLNRFHKTFVPHVPTQSFFFQKNAIQFHQYFITHSIKIVSLSPNLCAICQMPVVKKNIWFWVRAKVWHKCWWSFFIPSKGYWIIFSHEKNETLIFPIFEKKFVFDLLKFSLRWLPLPNVMRYVKNQFLFEVYRITRNQVKSNISNKTNNLNMETFIRESNQ